jgi:hypothetical protein
MDTPAPWGNRLLFPPIIKDKQNEPTMNTHLSALVKRVAELCEARLKACHCVEEFHLWQSRALGRQEKLAFECPRLNDPSHEPADDGICFLLNW